MSKSNLAIAHMAAQTTEARITVEVFGDIRCPFCYLEEPELRALERRFGELITIRFRPYELRPEAGRPALDPLGAFLTRIWCDSVLPMARKRGLTMRQPWRQPRSRCSMEAIYWAECHHGPRASAMFRLALFKAFFEDSIDLASHDELARVAVSIGADSQSLMEALQSERYTDHILSERRVGDALCLTGVPTIRFLVDGNHAAMLSGAQPRRLLIRTMKQLLDSYPQIWMLASS